MMKYSMNLSVTKSRYWFGSPFHRQISSRYASVDSLALRAQTSETEREPRRQSAGFGCVPSWFCDEMRRMVPLALPLFLALVMNTGFVTTVAFFAGRLGEVELGGVSLACSFISFSQNGMASGITTACDTLCAQAYGAGKRKKVGIYVQQGLLAMVLFSLVNGTLLLFVTPLMVSVGIDPRVARFSGNYVLFYLPGLVANCMFQVLTKYLLLQNRMSVVTGVTFIGNIVNIGGHLVLMTQFQLGIIGSALSVTLSNTAMLVLVVLYIYLSKIYVSTWPGWRMDAFNDWGLFTSYALPGMTMTSLEYFGYEMGSIFSGMISPVYASAILIYSQAAGIFYQLYLCVGISCSVRVGMCLGAGDLITAKRASTVAYTISVTLCIIPAATYIFAAPYLPRIFTSHEEVIEVVTLMFYIAIGYILTNALSTVQFGILRGCGLQKIGAVTTLAGYFGLTVPLSAALMFYTDLKGPGFVVSLCIGLFVITTALSIICYRIDWQDRIDQAKQAAEQNSVYDAIIDEETTLLAAEKSANAIRRSRSAIIPLEIKRETASNDSGSCLAVKRLMTFLICLISFSIAVMYKIYSGELDCIFANCESSINASSIIIAGPA